MLAEGQKVGNLRLRIARGAVISGVVVDHNGDPLSGANVNAMRYAYAPNGQRQLMPASSGQTDDRGQYRLWGLAAGEYVVSATAGIAAAHREAEITRLTEADIKRAFNALTRTAPAPSAAPATGTADDGAPARTVGYASVYYPGTFVATDATRLKLGAAEEKTAIDFPVTLVPTARVHGTVTMPEHISPQNVSVQLIGNNPAGFLLDMFRRAGVAPDGYFSFPSVTPGTYTIIVRGQPKPPPPAPGMRATIHPTHYATAEVTVQGEDVTGLSLSLQLGMTVAGRIQFEGTSTLPDLTRLRVSLSPMQGASEVSIGLTAVAPDANGVFSVPGVPPGRYRLNATIPSVRPDASPWRLKSSLIDGRDVLDFPAELTAPPQEVVITFSDRATEISGTIQDAAGQPAPENHVVVFAADRQYWLPQSRRVRSARPTADGNYTIPNLPPGDYLIAAIADLEPGEINDPAVLDQLSRVALKLTLSDGEKRTQNLRPASQQP